MPIYEYKCGSCGEHFTTLKLGSKAEVFCPRCGSPDVTKKLSTFYSSCSASSSGYSGGGWGGG